ncbi:MAG: Enolase [Parcubacteria group bacterium GW2011_GWC1_39_29]|uniref:Enolase n=1 Tax=Candidatus Yanofskybacteria bacterium GW2011_GWD1_39_16 TaxID=1619030 RepID=A0A837HPH5_9BACT|nr:MAG: Enolase [Candidatus Yanofskybacteria bacterium GW2011_GWD1_39_16]KKR14464.1 MAG: Enolase [Parcubacteria group bacterium GW2011_GWC1_39_29]
MNTKITKIAGEKILDSRGNATVRVTVDTSGGAGSFAVPSGASTGAFEANENKDINQVIQNIQNLIAPQLIGIEATEQDEIDKIMIELDGTANKSKLSGNAIIGVSVAAAKAAAHSLGQDLFEYLRSLTQIKSSRPVPYLFMNLINGGKHAHSKLPFQEYHIVPQVNSVEESLDMGTKIFKSLRERIDKEMSPSFSNVGDEGGATVDIGTTVETDDVFIPLKLLSETITQLGYTHKVRLAMDVAASSFFDGSNYMIGGNITSDQLYGIYKQMFAEFDIMSVEDPFNEEDFSNFARIHAEYPDKFIVGDDLTVTNVERLAMAINNKSINAIIIKPNQVGTLTETLNTMKMARENDIECIISHRSGETEDDFIADLAYAFGCFGLKSGAPNRGERVVKYNRLAHISKLR